METSQHHYISDSNPHAVGSFEYNPFASRFSEAQRRLQLAEHEKSGCSERLAWHSNFDAGAEAKALNASNREAQRISVALDEMKRGRNDLATKEGQLSLIAKPGLDPRRWFSAERLQHAKQRDELRARLVRLDKAMADLETDHAKALRASQSRQAQIEKYRALDPLELTAKLNALELGLEQQRRELADLLLDKQRVDALLSAPLQEQCELNDRLAILERGLELAESFDERLSSADNSYERAMVHQECSEAFDGEGRPGRVKQNKQREIQAIRRNLDKLDSRLRHIGRLASRPMSTLVIDGNNLCYEGREFIGLQPLHALSYALVEGHEVIVVFDASIRKLMRMNDEQVRYGFPREVRVHIVASKQAADLTVLELASPPDAYVISNDRFRDFTEKPAVGDQRLIRHEIVAGKVLVHDLNLAVAFTQEQRPEDPPAI